MKKKVILTIAVVCLLSAGLGTYFGFQNIKPSSLDSVGILLSDFDYGIDATLQNSDFVGMITVKDKKYKVGGHEMVLASVGESYMGSTVEKEIVIATGGRDKLTEGEDYLVFLKQFNHYAYSENTYGLAYSDSIYKVSFMKRINSLSELGEKTIKDVNTVAKLKEYISKYPKTMLERRDLVPDKFDSLEELIAYSDRIAKIKIKSVDDTISATFIADYDIVTVYKGEKWDAKEGNFLPRIFDKLDVGGEYMVFFIEEEDGTLMPATREDSLIAASDKRFIETEEYFK